MQPRSGLVQSADAQIFYLEYPSPHPHAQTLILLHGNGEDHRYFARQIAAFSARFRLVLMDTRGQGRSSAGRGKLNFSVFAQDLLRLMDALHIPKAHLLGFSDGGNLALTFALGPPAAGALAHPQWCKPCASGDASSCPAACCGRISPVRSALSLFAELSSKAADPGSDGQPSAHLSAPACGADDARSGHRRAARHDPPSAQPADCPLAAALPLCLPSRRQPLLRCQTARSF